MSKLTDEQKAIATKIGDVLGTLLSVLPVEGAAVAGPIVKAYGAGLLIPILESMGVGLTVTANVSPTTIAGGTVDLRTAGIAPGSPAGVQTPTPGPGPG